MKYVIPLLFFFGFTSSIIHAQDQPCQAGSPAEGKVEQVATEQISKRPVRPTSYMPYGRKKRYPHGRILIFSMGADMEYRRELTEVHAFPAPYESRGEIYSGQELLEAMKGDSIRLMVLYSHGSTKRIYGHNHKEERYYIDDGLATSPFEIDNFKHPKARSLDNLKKELEYYKTIKFSHDAVIYLGACWVAKAAKDETMFAKELARVTGVPVIAGSERTEPIEENHYELTYSNRVFFYEFYPDDRTNRIIGEYFCLSDLVKEYKNKILSDQKNAK